MTPWPLPHKLINSESIPLCEVHVVEKFGSAAVQQCSPDVHDILVLERTSHWYSQPSRVSFKFTKQGLKFYRQLAIANVSRSISLLCQYP